MNMSTVDNNTTPATPARYTPADKRASGRPAHLMCGPTTRGASAMRKQDRDGKTYRVNVDGQRLHVGPPKVGEDLTAEWTSGYHVLR